MNTTTLLNQYQAILELEAMGAWYLAKILRTQLITMMRLYDKSR